MPVVPTGGLYPDDVNDVTVQKGHPGNRVALRRFGPKIARTRSHNCDVTTRDLELQLPIT
jgi:hypothetical protein